MFCLQAPLPWSTEYTVALTRALTLCGNVGESLEKLSELTDSYAEVLISTMTNLQNPMHL